MQLGGLGIAMQGLHQHGHQITQTHGAEDVVSIAVVVVVLVGSSVVVTSVVKSVVVGSRN